MRFYKMHGCGNDFILINNRDARVPESKMREWALCLCRRGLGVGADGIIFLDATPPGRRSDYICHFLNADGMRSEMSGNGARCAAWLSMQLGLAGVRHTLGTDAGPIQAEVFSERGEVKIRLTRARDLRVNLNIEVEGETVTLHHVNLGAPHAVILVEDAKSAEVERLGKALRWHSGFQPDGANINFAQRLDPETLLVRTYERGVEAETFSCGTGACAALAITRALGQAGDSATVKTRLGDSLLVSVEEGEFYLRGPVKRVFEGRLDLVALELE